MNGRYPADHLAGIARCFIVAIRRCAEPVVGEVYRPQFNRREPICQLAYLVIGTIIRTAKPRNLDEWCFVRLATVVGAIL
jgi:hypothetical protein